MPTNRQLIKKQIIKEMSLHPNCLNGVGKGLDVERVVCLV